MDRTVQVGGGHASGQAGFVHVGLGTAERAEIRVQWPDGEWSRSFRVFANNFVLIEERRRAGAVLVPAGVRTGSPEPPHESFSSRLLAG